MLWDMSAMTLVTVLLLALTCQLARHFAQSSPPFQCAVAVTLFLRCLRARL